MQKIKPTTIDEYIYTAPPEAQKKLHEIRRILKEVAPDAKEAIKWGSPVFEGKRILFAFSSFRTHLNFTPTHTSLEPFRKELSGYKTGKDTISFPYDKPLPGELIRKIAAYRLSEVRDKDALWMTKKSS